MPSISQPDPTRRVLVAGGGVAAVEALLALHDLGDGRFDLTLLSPDEDFVVRAMSVAEPFAAGHAPRVSMRETCDHLGARRFVARLASVDADAQIAWTDDGNAIAYDELIVATGASAVPAFDHALTFSDAEPVRLNGLLADIDGGYCHSLAIVVPRSGSWALPAYELALLIAESAFNANQAMEMHLVTPEPDALAIFGAAAGDAVRRLLEGAGVQLHLNAYATVERGGRIRIAPGDVELHVDRVVALPELRGRPIRGLPADEHGFIPTDDHARVRGVEHVYAAGDGADYAVKQGGLATQQADAAVRHIASAAGAPVEASPFRPILRGTLLTGGAPRYLRSEPSIDGAPSTASTRPLWSAPGKVVGEYLAPWLAAHDGLAPHRADPPAAPADPAAVDIELELPDDRSRSALALDTLGPIAPSHSR